MANHYRHPKLAVDGRHTAAPKQHGGKYISEYTIHWVPFLDTQAFFGQVYSDRYFLELHFQNLCTELLLVLRAPVESPLKEVPRYSLIYHTLTPARPLFRTPIC
jgi:hypothetical protein